MIGQDRVGDLSFAADVALRADSWLARAAMIMEMEFVTQSFGINIIARKSALQYMDRDLGIVGEENTSLRSQMMKHVEDFT